MKKVDWKHFWEVHKNAYIGIKAFYQGGDDVKLELYCMECSNDKEV